MFRPLPLYLADGYKVGHPNMISPEALREYWHGIPRSIKYGPEGATHIVCFGHEYAWRYIIDIFNENFFNQDIEEAKRFGRDMSAYLMQPYVSKHFEDLHKLGYLPVNVKALPEGLETLPNIPHQTGVTTVDGFAWLGLYLETINSALVWRPTVAATIGKQFLKNTTEFVMKYDPDNAWLIDYMNHDFSARGLNGMDGMLQTGMGFATASRGSDTMITIPGTRYYYPTGDPDYMAVHSVNASEHSVTTTMIFTVGELKTLETWLKKFDKGILSFVADTFDLTEIVRPDIRGTLVKLKEAILNRDGKLVIRPDSNPEPLTPVEIICGWNGELTDRMREADYPEFYHKGLIQCLWEIFGGDTNEQGLKRLNPCIGAIYGDAINLDRQIKIYQGLVDKGFAPTNIVLGVGSYTLQMNTRDTVGYAFKGAAFLKSNGEWVPIYKEPITDDGTKTSPKGLQMVYRDESGEIRNKSNCTVEEEKTGLLALIVENGKMVRRTSFETIRGRVKASL